MVRNALLLPGAKRVLLFTSLDQARIRGTITRMPYRVLHRPKGAPEERLLLVGTFEDHFYAALRRTNWLVEEVLSGSEALAEAARREYGVVLCSLRMEDAWGLDILQAILKADPLTPVLISTKERNPRIIVEAMQRGAFDYVIEPFEDLDFVLSAIARAVRRRAALRRGRSLREVLGRGEGAALEGLLGRSAPLLELCGRIRQAAPSPAPVLIEGESGTGKELVAQALHRASPRRQGPFIAVHCGAIAEGLLESELFGHEKGAFTGAQSTRVGVFESAHGGTIFLDEVGLTSPACQAKLLRVLESNTIRRVGASRELAVDVRVLSATNEPLANLVERATFRQDLFYRLNVLALRVPPLRERSEDIPLLSHAFAERFAQESGKSFAAFSEEAFAALRAYSFPGNVRELRNAVERAVVLGRGPVLGLADLPESMRKAGAGQAPGDATKEGEDRFGISAWSELPAGMGLEQELARIEKRWIEQALQANSGNRSRAAAHLKLKRTTLLQKMSRMGMGKQRSVPAGRPAGRRAKSKMPGRRRVGKRQEKRRKPGRGKA